jgi:signal transduction histidine kinase/ActR/RegA family two-component response regulator
MLSTTRSWFTSRGRALMAGLLGLMGLLGIYLGFANQRALDWISHTSNVQRTLSQLSVSLIDASQAELLFLVTGETTGNGYLAKRSLAQRTALEQLEFAAKLVADNSEQSQFLIELKPLIEQRFATGQALIDARRAVDFRSDIAVPLTLRGQEQLAAVRKKLSELQSVETTLFDARTATALSAQRTFVIAIGAGVLAVAAALLLWWKETQNAFKVLAVSNSKLVDSLAETQAADDQIRQMQKLEAVGQLTGGLAHDFNNMLAIIISSLNLAQKRLAKGPANIDALLAGALDGAHRAATLTSRLLAFSRQHPLAPETLDLNRIVGGMSEMITRTLGDSIRVETVLAGGLWTAHIDISQLENALLNLCVNARDAMPDGGSLTIETGNASLDDAYARQHLDVTAGQYVLIAVTDSGTGMAPEVIAKAYDPFFTTKDVGKGSGLGLSQVFGFVKQSGGHLKIYSEVGQGTTLKIYLPRSFETVQASRAATKLQITESAEMTRGNLRQIILVVEDESHVRGLTVATLRELGYTVIHAEDAITALKQLDAHPEVGLLFTDIVMPGMNGRKLADEAVRRQSQLKVLFTTGFTRNAVVHGGVLDAGVNFIAKPFTIEQLAAKVGQVVAQPAL